MWQKLAHSWKESINFINPTMLGLSIWSLIDAYVCLLGAWFVPIALIVGLVLSIPSLLYSFLLVFIARATRPSMELKNQEYWQQFFIADWVLYFTLVVLIQITYTLPPSIGATLYSVFLKSIFIEDIMPGSLGVGSLFLSPFVIWWVLFMLDSRLSLLEYVKSFFRALAMMLYSYPFALLTYMVARIMLAGIAFLSSSFPQLTSLGWVLLIGVFYPYYVCFMSNFYVQRLHSQFGVYYGR